MSVLPESHLDGVVLALLEGRRRAYGRELAQALRGADPAAVHASLRRLEREGLVAGRRRRRLTRQGGEALAARRLEWRTAARA
jgi:DNA-binding PadR family transcriptional regulator